MRVANLHWMIAFFVASALHVGVIVAVTWFKTDREFGIAEIAATHDSQRQVRFATIGGAIAAQAAAAASGEAVASSDVLQRIAPTSGLTSPEGMRVAPAIDTSHDAVDPLNTPPEKLQDIIAVDPAVAEASLEYLAYETQPLAGGALAVPDQPIEFVSPLLPDPQEYAIADAVETIADANRALPRQTLRPLAENSKSDRVRQSATPAETLDETAANRHTERVVATAPTTARLPTADWSDENGVSNEAFDVPDETLASVPAGSATNPADGQDAAHAGMSAAVDHSEYRTIRLEYLQSVVKKIVRHKRYPRSARKDGAIGQVTVRFSILADGSLHNPIVTSSSGDHRLDQAAVSMLSRASPFAPIPKSLNESQLNVSLPVNFAIAK